MAEKVKTTGVSKASGYLYYLGKDGNVWRSQMSRGGSGGGNAEKVANITKEFQINKKMDTIKLVAL